MRVAVMLRHLKTQRGGIGTYSRSLLDHLIQIDAENEYVLLYADEEMRGSYSSYPKVREVVVPRLPNLLWDQLLVPWTAHREGVDVIFNPKMSVPLFTSRSSVFVLHGGDWFAFPENYKLHDRIYHRVFAPLYCRRADAVVSVSQSATEDIEEAVKAARDKTRTIYHGVDERFQQIRDQQDLERVRSEYDLPERFVLWVGQIYPMKNVRGLLRAFARIRDRVPHHLVLVGKLELKYDRELALIEELNLEDRVKLTGWVPDEAVPAFYNLADLFAFPSLYEGFGIPILEAMRCGCPVLTSRGGATEEVAGDAAELVDPESSMEIAEGMLKLLKSDEVREQLIERGRQRADLFTWERCARETLELLESLAD